MWKIELSGFTKANYRQFIHFKVFTKHSFVNSEDDLSSKNCLV